MFGGAAVYVLATFAVATKDPYFVRSWIIFTFIRITHNIYMNYMKDPNHCPIRPFSMIWKVCATL